MVKVEKMKSYATVKYWISCKCKSGVENYIIVWLIQNRSKHIALVNFMFNKMRDFSKESVQQSPK